MPVICPMKVCEMLDKTKIIIGYADKKAWSWIREVTNILAINKYRKTRIQLTDFFKKLVLAINITVTVLTPLYGHISCDLNTFYSLTKLVVKFLTL